MQEYKKFTKDVFIVGFAQILMSLRGLVIIPILAKTLGASLYGIYATLIVTVSLLSTFSVLGLRQSLIRFIAGEKDKEEIREGYYSILLFVFLFSSLISLLVFFAADILAATVFGDSGSGEVIRIGSFLILIWSIDFINLDFFRAVRRMLRMSVLQVFQTLGEVSLAAFFVLNGFGLDMVVYSFIAIRFSVFLISFILIGRLIGFKIPDFSNIKQYLSFGLPLVPIALFSWIISSSDRYVIGYFLDSFNVGIYSAAYGIGSVVMMFMNALHFVLFPTLTKLWSDEKKEDFKRHLSYSLKYFLLFAIPSVFGLTALSFPILRIMATVEFASLGADVIPLVALATLFYGVYMVPMNVLMVAKNRRPLLSSFFVSSFMNMGLNILLVPLLGIIGAAVSTLVSIFLLLLFVLRSSADYVTIPVNWPFILKASFSSLLMVFMLYFLHPIGFVDVLFSIFTGVIVYFVILFISGGFNKSELDFFKKLFFDGLKYIV